MRRDAVKSVLVSMTDDAACIQLTCDSPKCRSFRSSTASLMAARGSCLSCERLMPGRTPRRRCTSRRVKRLRAGNDWDCERRRKRLEAWSTTDNTHDSRTAGRQRNQRTTRMTAERQVDSKINGQHAWQLNGRWTMKSTDNTHDS